MLRQSEKALPPNPTPPHPISDPRPSPTKLNTNLFQLLARRLTAPDCHLLPHTTCRATGKVPALSLPRPHFSSSKARPQPCLGHSQGHEPGGLFPCALTWLGWKDTKVSGWETRGVRRNALPRGAQLGPAGPAAQAHILKSSLSYYGPLATASLGKWLRTAILGQLELSRP